MAIGLFAAAGLLWWTLLEYLLHRFVFHRFPRTLGRRHLQHHAQPRVRSLARAPLPSSLGGLSLHALVLTPLWGLDRAAAFVAGVAIGYMAYEWIHWQLHSGQQTSRRFPVLRRHHLMHHHLHAGSRFGVSSRFWDRLFGTMGPSERPPARQPGGAPTGLPFRGMGDGRSGGVGERGEKSRS